MRPSRVSPAAAAPLDELLANVLRQFKRPLATRNLDLTDADAKTIATRAANRRPLDDMARRVRAALVELVAESEGVLAQWNLTFEQSLKTSMDAISDWETTADFLTLANEKSNAELRIAAGSALVAALGDFRYTFHLLYLAARRDDDFDTILARRVLCLISGVNPAAPDWLVQVRAWVQRHGRR